MRGKDTHPRFVYTMPAYRKTGENVCVLFICVCTHRHTQTNTNTILSLSLSLFLSRSLSHTHVLDVRFSLFSAGQVCVRLPLHARHVFFHERFAFMKVIQREAALLRWGRIDFAAHSYDLVTQHHCTPRACPCGIPLSLPVCRRSAH